MKVRELLRKISLGIIMVDIDEPRLPDNEIEVLLERVKFLWLRERPQRLHTLN